MIQWRSVYTDRFIQQYFYMQCYLNSLLCSKTSRCKEAGLCFIKFHVFSNLGSSMLSRYLPHKWYLAFSFMSILEIVQTRRIIHSVVLL